MGVELPIKKQALATGLVALVTVLFPFSTASASVDDFTFDSFDGVYEIGVDDDGTATLVTTETLVAVFPDFDQNRGIARYLPTRYLGRPLVTEVIDVTDEKGQPRPWATARDGSAFVIESVVPRGEYVRGENTYVFKYRQDNVVRDFGETTGVQEFYWDINGSGWPQPFGTVSATVVIPATLALALAGAGDSCYQGAAGSTERCDITREIAPDGSVTIFATAGPLAPYETMTVAIGFVPGTFAAPPPQQASLLTLLAHGAGSLAGGVALVWAVVVRRKFLADAPGRPVIIPEYLPPKQATISVSAILKNQSGRIPLAGLLEMAVAKKIHLSENPGVGRRWSLVRRDATLTPSDTELLTVLFGSVPPVGQSVPLPKNSTSVPKRLENFVRDHRRKMVTEGVYASVPIPHRLGPIFVGGLAAILGVSGYALFGSETVDILTRAITVGIVVSAVVAILLIAKTPLGPAGAELRDELKGLRLYIRFAEKDRLHYLQSPQGAIRERVSAEDSREVLKLHERLLPWAVILGEEKRWVKELDRLYQDQSPDWISGTSPRLIASLGSFSQATSTSFGSSSSGGTGGGGSAGGGGGGGGGGGR